MGVPKTYERYIFNLRNQHSDESIDEYVTELKHLSKSCNYLCDSLLRDKLIMGIVDKETRKVTPNEKADIRIVCHKFNCSYS